MSAIAPIGSVSRDGRGGPSSGRVAHARHRWYVAPGTGIDAPKYGLAGAPPCTPTLCHAAGRTLPLSTTGTRTVENIVQSEATDHMASMAVNELGPMLTATEVADMLHPARQHGEAARRSRRAAVLSGLQARRSSVPARRRHEVPVPEPLIFSPASAARSPIRTRRRRAGDFESRAWPLASVSPKISTASAISAASTSIGGIQRIDLRAAGRRSGPADPASAQAAIRPVAAARRPARASRDRARTPRRPSGPARGCRRSGRPRRRSGPRPAQLGAACRRRWRRDPRRGSSRGRPSPAAQATGLPPYVEPWAPRPQRSWSSR